jgi:hypothetical protein
MEKGGIAVTIIEFFDKTAIENMLSAMLCKPDRVVYVGSSKKAIEKCLDAYREVLAQRGLQVELVARAINRNNLQRIVESLSELVERDDSCVFNLDGGEDLYLVAVGMVAQKYPDRVSLHRFNIRNNTILDCDADGNNQLQEPIEISVQENIRIYGGRVLTAEQHPDGMYNWNFSPVFREDVKRLWEICCRHKADWNNTVTTIGVVSSLLPHEDPRGFHAVRSLAEPVLRCHDVRYQFDPSVLQDLADAGLIYYLSADANEVEFLFKSEQVKRALSKAGQVLELMVTLAALDAVDEDGTPVYNDVRCGVYIDWDGLTGPDAPTEVSNEIDVLLMKGAVPVFVSCKNGNVEREELFMLDTVASYFGGKYARKVLVAPKLDRLGSKGRAIQARANEMDIRTVPDFEDMTYEQMIKEVTCLWQNAR